MEWLGTPWGALVALIVGAAVVSLAALGFRIKKNADGTEISRGGDKGCEPLIPRKLAQHVYILTLEVVRHNDALSTLWPKCLEEQMRIYEERELAAVAMFVTEFTGIVEATEGLGDAEVESEIASFRSIILLAFCEVKDRMRRAFRNNHFYELSNDEWIRYKDGKARLISDTVSHQLDISWRSHHVPRRKLRQIGLDDFGQYKQIIDDIFEKAKSISIRAYEKEQEEKARYKAYLAATLGIDTADDGHFEGLV
jgi:hypothetical protein